MSMGLGIFFHRLLTKWYKEAFTAFKFEGD